MLNNTFFDNSNGIVLGANCHQQHQAAIPVWVVTDLKGEILISNAIEGANAWVVTGGRITLNRFFQACTAMVVCTTQNVNMNLAYPELPSKVARSLQSTKSTSGSVLDYLPDDKTYPLDKNDEICIWAGYIDEIRPVTQNDFKSGNLVRRFVGVIDTIATAGTSTQGVNIIIQCRDRMKYLMDSMGTFNTSDFDPFRSGEGQSLDLGTEDAAASTGEEFNRFDPRGYIPGFGNTPDTNYSITRVDVIIELARRCIGHLGEAKSIKNYVSECDSVCGMRIDKGYIADYAENPDPDTIQMSGIYDPGNGSKPLSGRRSAAANNSSMPFIGGVVATKEIALASPNPVMNIITGRQPFRTSNAQSNFLGTNHSITDRVPAEFIKFLSLQEPWPTEFFCDSRTGEYWYAPRGLDVSGLRDPQRFYRTYFFRNAPERAIKALSLSAISSYVQTNENDIAQSIIDEDLDAAGLEFDNFTLSKAQYNFLVNELNRSEIYRADSLDLAPNLSDATAAFIESNDINDLNGLQKLVFDRTNNERKASKAKQNLNIRDIEGSAIHTAQAALLFREESSTINWRSNIIVTNQNALGSGANQSATHLRLTPPWLAGRNYACSYFSVIDLTIGDNKAELVAVAMSFARIYGKELRAATMHILGDPSIVPGEAVQVFGSPMHPKSMQSDGQRNWLWDRKAIGSYIQGYNDLSKNLIKAIKEDSEYTAASSEPKPAVATNDDPDTIREQIAGASKGVQVATNSVNYSQARLMCPAAIGGDAPPEGGDNAQATSAVANKGSQNVVFPEDPKTIWRVEAVIEKFNEQPGSGYKTELALLSPF